MMIREYINLAMLVEKRKRKRKKRNSKYAIISAQSSGDMSQILNWLRLNKAIRNAGEIRQSGNSYIVKVKVRSKYNKSSLAELVKSKFGIFGSVR